jgi:hypothetical protein
MNLHKKQLLTYESARTLKDLELLEKMETIDELDDEIAYLQNQISILKKESHDIQLNNHLKLKQMQHFENQFSNNPIDETDSEIYRSFSKREGFQNKLKLGDLVVFGDSKEDQDDGPTIGKKFKSQVNSRRNISMVSRSLDVRKDFHLLRQSQIFKKMQVGKSESQKRWELLGFKNEKETAYSLDDQVNISI